MKRSLFLISLLFLSTLSFADVEVFTQRAYCEINAGRSANCEVCNFESYAPIHCEMSIRGRTLYGFWFQGSQVGAIPYGQCMYGYVYANNPIRDPLVSADAYASCRRRL